MKVLVVDDSTEGRAGSLAESLDLRCRPTVVHCGSGNVAKARNACLDHADGDFILFIDDDEVAPPSWVTDFITQAEMNNADCTFAPVRPVYRPDAPKWLTKLSPLYASPEAMTRSRRGQIIGQTGNSAIRRSFIEDHDLRFDPKYATIGEDSFFFEACRQAGAKMTIVSAPIVEEQVRDDHHRFSFVMRTRFGRGQAYADIRLRFAKRPAIVRCDLFIRGLLGVSLSSLMLPFSPLGGTTGVARVLLRAALDAGKIVRTLRYT